MKNQIKDLFSCVFKKPMFAWIMLGFFVSYFLFFIYDQFLTRSAMSFLPYIPAKDAFGYDLRTTFDHLSRWYVEKQSPYTQDSLHAYPPLINILLFPLIFLEFSSAYKLIVFLSIASYLLPILFFLEPEGKLFSPIPTLILITGLISYGFEFELERGQFDYIVILICFFSIWLFHKKKKLRFLSYILFTISVNTKLFPLLFVFMFMDDLHDWKGNIKRMMLLGILNVAMLFVLGPKVFMDFLNAILRHSDSTKFIWIGNHSIKSFVFLLFEWFDKGLKWDWVNQYSYLVELFLTLITFGCIALILVRSYRKNVKGMNTVLFFACTVAALTITPTSHDYTLPILSLPVILIFKNEDFWMDFDRGLRSLSIFLLFVFSLAYSSTLFSYLNKPHVLGGILANSFVPLFGMLLIVTTVSFLQTKTSVGQSEI